MNGEAVIQKLGSALDYRCRNRDTISECRFGMTILESVGVWHY